MKEKSVFETLSAIDVNKHVEKSNGLTYLPWAVAWAEVKKLYPDAGYKVITHPETKLPYIEDNDFGVMVSTEVTIMGETLGMWLPVMDSKFKAMKRQPYSYKTKYGDKEVTAITMHDINRSTMRCLTKNLAMFGLGHYIYAKEESPSSEEVSDPAPTETKSKKITLEVGSENWKKVLNFIAVKKDTMGLEEIIRTFSTKYEIPMDVKTSIEKEVEKK